MTLLFRTEYGSRAMGMATEDSDHDFMEVHLEPWEAVLGLDSYDAKHTSTAGDGRSGPGDTDTVKYGLKHWASLAAKGNPTAMTPLWVPHHLVHANHLGFQILDNYRMFVSKDAARQARGYARAQYEALQGLRNKKTNRPELIHKHGYDTKFAYHALRTLMQGYELLTNTFVELPINGERREILMAIREGRLSKGDFLEMFQAWDGMMSVALDTVQMREHADRDGINNLLYATYVEGYGLDG